MIKVFAAIAAGYWIGKNKEKTVTVMIEEAIEKARKLTEVLGLTSSTEDKEYREGLRKLYEGDLAAAGRSEPTREEVEALKDRDDWS